MTFHKHGMFGTNLFFNPVLQKTDILVTEYYLNSVIFPPVSTPGV